MGILINDYLHLNEESEGSAKKEDETVKKALNSKDFRICFLMGICTLSKVNNLI